MNILKRFVSGLGQQTAPFGFAPNDPEASYKAGLGYIGDVGANLMANNQGGVDPFANLGASLQQAKAQGVDRNKEQYSARLMMEQAEENRRKRDEEAARQQQMEAAISQLPPDQQALARMLPERFFGAQIDEMYGSPNLTADMLNFQFAQENPEFAAHLERKQSSGGGRSFAPIPYTREDGTIGFGIPRDDGSFVDVQTPEGAQFLSPYERAYQQNFGSAQGKSDGEGLAAASSDIAAADLALEKIAAIKDDPNREWATGASSVLNIVPGTPGFDFQARVDELTSGAFLAAIQELRGMGALSNAEGQTATQAVTRLKTAATEQGFLDALDDYERYVTLGRNRATKRLNRPIPGKTDMVRSPSNPPKGVTTEEWNAMTDKERAEWK